MTIPNINFRPVLAPQIDVTPTEQLVQLCKDNIEKNLRLLAFGDPYSDPSNIEKMRRLLQNGADPNIEFAYDFNGNNKNLTPLMQAALFLDFEFINLLIDYGANVNAVSKGDGDTALHNAIRIAFLNIGYAVDHQEDIFNVCKLLIDKGANVNIQNCNEETPLMNAAHFAFPQVCKLFCECGANVNAAKANGKTAVMDLLSQLCVRDGSGEAQDDVDSLKILLENGADPNDQIDRIPALMVAVRYNAPILCKLLIQFGANPYADDDIVRRAFEEISEIPNSKIRKLFSHHKEIDAVYCCEENKSSLNKRVEKWVESKQASNIIEALDNASGCGK